MPMAVLDLNSAMTYAKRTNGTDSFWEIIFSRAPHHRYTVPTTVFIILQFHPFLVSLVPPSSPVVDATNVSLGTGTDTVIELIKSCYSFSFEHEDIHRYRIT